jgi:hypothetical protein
MEREKLGKRVAIEAKSHRRKSHGCGITWANNGEVGCCFECVVRLLQKVKSLGLPVVL